MRAFRAGGPQPYVLAGISSARTETYLTACIADRGVPTVVGCEEPDVRERHRERFPSGSAYVHAGAGVDVPLAGRLHLAPDVRVHLAATSIIVRPAVGVVLDF